MPPTNRIRENKKITITIDHPILRLSCGGQMLPSSKYLNRTENTSNMLITVLQGQK